MVDRKLLAVFIIAAVFIFATGVMASDGSSDSGSSGSSDSGSSGSGDSGSSGASDSGSSGSSDSGSSGTSDSVKDKSGSSGSDSSKSDISSGSDKSSPDSKSPDASPGISASGSSSSSADPVAGMLESEIEHGITTIVADESARMSAAGISSGSSSGSDPASDSPGRSTIASGSLKALAGLPGTTAPLLGELAASIDETLPHLAESEKAIRDRSWIMTFFFGGDDSAAGDIEMHVSEDMDSLDKMDQILNDPSTSPAIRTFTRERETIIRSDLLRLQSLAVTEKMKKGLFG